MITLFKNFFNKYFLIILGLILFLIYFWNRFLRTRISKPLPLDFTVLKFFITLNICLIFFYIIISLLFPRKHNKLIEQIINWLFIPIIAFDKYVKSLPYMKLAYDKFIDIIIPKLDFLIIKTNLFYIIFWIFPRMVLLMALFVDVFIFHKLHYKYMVILFGLLLFFNRYFRYSLKNTKEDLIEYYSKYIRGIQTDYYPNVHPCELEPDYDPEEEDGYAMFLPLDIFIKHAIEFQVYKDIIVEKHIVSTTSLLREELWEKYIKQKAPIIYWKSKDVPKDYTNIFGNNVPENYHIADNLIMKKTQEFKKDALDKILKVALILEHYNYTSNYHQEIKNIKILIYINYLLCWLYVLIISLPMLNTLEFMMVINKTWLEIENPFIS